MPGNPQIPQGTLNLIIVGVQFDNLPGLNISASYLAKSMVRLRLEGDITAYHDVATGAVTSPQPYQMATVECGLLKSQALGQAFKTQLETNSLIGNYTIYPDVAGGNYTYTITNGAIKMAEPGAFDGVAVEWVLTLGGVYLINSGLWP